jgi:hypothetical protein
MPRFSRDGDMPVNETRPMLQHLVGWAWCRSHTVAPTPFRGTSAAPVLSKARIFATGG